MPISRSVATISTPSCFASIKNIRQDRHGVALFDDTLHPLKTRQEFISPDSYLHDLLSRTTACGATFLRICSFKLSNVVKVLSASFAFAICRQA